MSWILLSWRLSRAVLTTVAQYRSITRDVAGTLDTIARRPEVDRETRYYLSEISNAKTIDDFVDNDRLFSYAMRAHGLSEMTYAKAFMKKVLTEGVDDRKAFANQLADSRYREFAAAFNFNRHGSAAVVFNSATIDTTTKYVRQVLEETGGAENEGVRLALYFERKAPTLTSAYGILADRALLKVVQTALALPAQMGTLDIDKQAAQLSERIDIADFKDPTKLTAFIERFASLYEFERASATSLPSGIVPLTPLGSGPGFATIGSDLLSQIAKLRIGG